MPEEVGEEGVGFSAASGARAEAFGNCRIEMDGDGVAGDEAGGAVGRERSRKGRWGREGRFRSRWHELRLQRCSELVNPFPSQRRGPSASLRT